MATLSKVDSRRMYSWWWNSHISPKNSKWLHENLSDVDIKVKAMIKLIEEDADSFARRAEMYYEKRPELIKLVEELYRAYRALAERYDHATGALRQAHKTMSEAFPNQVPDDSASNSPYDSDPQTPYSRTITIPSFDHVDFQKDGSTGTARKALSFTDSEDANSINNKHRSQFDKEIVLLKEALVKLEDEKEAGMKQYLESLDKLSKLESEILKLQEDSRKLADCASRAEAESQKLKEELKKLEVEKEEGIGLYHQVQKNIEEINEQHLKEMKRLEDEKEESIGLYHQAQKEIEEINEQNLKEVKRLEVEKEESIGLYHQAQKKIEEINEQSFKEIKRLEVEKEEGIGLYHQAQKKIEEINEQNLKEIKRLEVEKEEGIGLYHQAQKRIEEINEQNLKEIKRLEVEKEEGIGLYHQAQKKIEEINEENLKEVKRLEDERDAAYDKCTQSINLQLDLEKKLLEVEKKLLEASSEIVKLTEEKKAQDVLYQQCMETISSLELRLVCAQEETERLKTEIDNGISLLKDAEERRLMLEKSNTNLRMELESKEVKISSQCQEITEKQKELGRLWTCIQEERIRFVEAETAFQTLQQLHAQSQEELRSMASELQSRAQVLCDINARNRVLEGEIENKIKENEKLSEVNLSSVISLNEMQAEIGKLKEANGRLEEEVDLRVDQRNALQQEIYCLKEEINELNKKHESVLEQVVYVGLNPESFGSSVKDLQNETFNLKEELQKEKTEKTRLLTKLEIMGQLLERNVVLENSLSDLGAELDGVRGKLKSLEESYRFLLEEKSNLAVAKANLLGQLQVTTENLSHVSEKNTVLENSLFDAHVKLEILKQKSKNFEDSCQLLADEKSALVTEKGSLVTKIEVTETKLKDLEMKYTDLEDKYSLMEKERESTLQRVKELNVSLDLQSQEHVTFAQENNQQLEAMRSEIQLLKQESQHKSKEFDQEVDKSFGLEIEILILSNCVQDLEESNFSLLNDCHKLQEASKLSESLIHVLKQEKNKNQMKITSLTDQNNRLTNGVYQLLKSVGLSLHTECENGQEQTCFNNIEKQIEGKNRTLIKNEDENMKLVVETTILVTFLSQLKSKLANLELEKCAIEQESSVRAEKILGLQNEVLRISEKNEELRLKVIEGDVNESDLRTQLENIQHELSVVQEASRTLQMENAVVLEENKSLLGDNVQIKNKIHVLEDENDIILNNILSQEVFSQSLKNYIDEKHEEFRAVQSVCERLNLDLVNRNNLLQLKEKEIKILENEKKDLQRKNNEKILKLLEDNNHLSKEIQRFEAKFQKLSEKFEKTEEKTRLLEIEGSLIYQDLQTSVICQVLLEQKVGELIEVCLNLEDEINFKDLNNESVKERSNILECENVDLKDRLDAYGPVVESLRDSIISLENHTCVKIKVSQPENEKGDEFATVERDAFVELQDLQTKVKLIETAVTEMQTLATQQKLDSDAKLESAMMQIKELSQRKNPGRAKSQRKSTPEISVPDPKNIMLDKASECSSYNVSKRGLTEGEIWETTNDCKHMSKHHPTASDTSLDDILEVSRRFKEPREDGNKTKVLERLNSDVLKLTNLQITIDDLKRKVETALTSRKGKPMIECELVKGQLTEAESAIEKLHEINARLVQHIEGDSESGESESARREKVSGQARRVSEKIGRLQVEIQKIQFKLLKLDDVNTSSERKRFLDTKKRVVLKDYLYGGGRTRAANNRRKKGHFCACAEPSTKGD
ncbi:protein NETWORKED 1D-like [Bidens hawaiensis]|uniref:protein NETWORKED 1D-like n=1 Tax=Bidens hawaiensis TaxID=980011 RepID=UPI00404A056D